MSEIDWYKKTERPEERTLRRKLRRMEILQWGGLAVLTPLSILLFWLLLLIMPDQLSAINDLAEDAAGTEARHTDREVRP